MVFQRNVINIRLYLLNSPNYSLSNLFHFDTLFWRCISEAPLLAKGSLARRKSMGSHFGSWSKIVSATAATHGSQVSCGKAPSFEPWKSSWLHSWLTRFSPPKLEMYGMMYSHDKMMMNSKPLGPTISGTNCFTGRYSPTYRVPEQMRDPMRRCMTNPPVSQFQLLLWSQRQKANFCWLDGANHWILDLVT